MRNSSLSSQTFIEECLSAAGILQRPADVERPFLLVVIGCPRPMRACQKSGANLWKSG